MCQRFPALSPLALDECRAVDVFRMVHDLNDYIDREEKDKQETKTSVAPSGKRKYSVKVMD